MQGDEVEQLADAFISGADVSIHLANRLEVLLDEAFPDDDHMQETVEMLARYRPGGGEWLLDTDALRERLIATLGYLHRAGVH